MPRLKVASHQYRSIVTLKQFQPGTTDSPFPTRPLSSHPPCTKVLKLPSSPSHPLLATPPLPQPYSSTIFLYSSPPINPSTSPLPPSPTSILAIHPSPSGPLLIIPGFSSSTPFASMIFPDTGVMMSDADFTDSTAPMLSPLLISRPRAGSST